MNTIITVVRGTIATVLRIIAILQINGIRVASVPNDSVIIYSRLIGDDNAGTFSVFTRNKVKKVYSDGSTSGFAIRANGFGIASVLFVPAIVTSRESAL